MKRVPQYPILATFSVLQFQSQVKAISFVVVVGGHGYKGDGVRGRGGSSNGLEALNVRTFHLLLPLLQLPLDGNF